MNEFISENQFLHVNYVFFFLLSSNSFYEYSIERYFAVYDRQLLFLSLTKVKYENLISRWLWVSASVFRLRQKILRRSHVVFILVYRRIRKWRINFIKIQCQMTKRIKLVRRSFWMINYLSFTFTYLLSVRWTIFCLSRKRNIFDDNRIVFVCFLHFFFQLRRIVCRLPHFMLLSLMKL